MHDFSGTIIYKSRFSWFSIATLQDLFADHSCDAPVEATEREVSSVLCVSKALGRVLHRFFFPIQHDPAEQEMLIYVYHCLSCFKMFHVRS